MAERVSIHFIDDLDGRSEADLTIRFAVDGFEYELDLSEEHATELRAVFKPYIQAARRVS